MIKKICCIKVITIDTHLELSCPCHISHKKCQTSSQDILLSFPFPQLPVEEDIDLSDVDLDDLDKDEL